MRLMTVELVPRVLWGDPVTCVEMFWLTTGYEDTNAAYMARTNTYLLTQGRLPVDASNEQCFLAGLAAQGIVRIEED